MPTAFFAATLNQYVDPFVSPVAVHVRAVELAAPSHPAAVANVPEALVATCTLYPVIADPPLLMGANHLTVTEATRSVGGTQAGTPGTPAGVTDADAAEAAEEPTLFVAVAVNVYAVPFARPLTSQDPDAPGTVHVPAEADDDDDAVTVKDVGAPPAPAATVTVTLVLPAATLGVAGAPGAARDCRLTAGEPAENSPVVSAPVATLLFRAATRNEYVPSAKPVAVQLVEMDDFVEALAHPEPAADHGPFTPDATCTSYPTSLFAELTTFACCHVTSI